MKIQAIVTQSTTDSAPLINFANSNLDQNARETIALVQRVMEDAGTDKHTFCLLLLSSKVKVGKPLAGICLSVIQMKEKEDEELPSYSQAVSALDSCDFVITFQFF